MSIWINVSPNSYYVARVKKEAAGRKILTAKQASALKLINYGTWKFVKSGTRVKIHIIQGHKCPYRHLNKTLYGTKGVTIDPYAVGYETCRVARVARSSSVPYETSNNQKKYFHCQPCGSYGGEAIKRKFGCGIWYFILKHRWVNFMQGS